MVRKKDTPSKSVNNKPPKRTKTGDTRSKTIKDIIRLQKTTHLLIPKLAFARVVKEVFQDFVEGYESFRIQGVALQALQEAAEMYLVHFFQHAYQCTLHAKRVTLMPSDMRLLKRIRD